MANGKGTIGCWYCRHVTWGPDYRCELHNANLSVKSSASLNLLCRDFEEGPQSEATFLLGSQFKELAPHMRKRVLYCFPYPSHNRAADLKELATFKE